MNAAANTALVIALGLLAGPALADWTQTKWGISPQSVVAAYEGASLHDPDPSEATTDASGTYLPKVMMAEDVEGIPTTVRFLFDDADTLRFITLEPDALDDCDQLVDVLSARHGQGDALDAGGISITDWTAGDAAVKFTSVANAFCVLSYSPR